MVKANQPATGRADMLCGDAIRVRIRGSAPLHRGDFVA